MVLAVTTSFHGVSTVSVSQPSLSLHDELTCNRSLTKVGDRPTLVVGVGMVHGRGRSAKTVFAASVCLDSGCMRLAHSCFVNRRSETILDLEMQDIIETSIKHYKRDSERDPER